MSSSVAELSLYIYFEAKAAGGGGCEIERKINSFV